jgi:hypothetical protein
MKQNKMNISFHTTYRKTLYVILCVMKHRCLVICAVGRKGLRHLTLTSLCAVTNLKIWSIHECSISISIGQCGKLCTYTHA